MRIRNPDIYIKGLIDVMTDELPVPGPVGGTGVWVDEPLAVHLGVVLLLAGRKAQILLGLVASHVVAVDRNVLAAQDQQVLTVSRVLHTSK